MKKGSKLPRKQFANHLDKYKEHTIDLSNFQLYLLQSITKLAKPKTLKDKLLKKGRG